MSTDTDTLADFLLARIAEDEARAVSASLEVPQTRTNGQVWGVWLGNKWYQSSAYAAHVRAYDPARVLAECGAKREVIRLHASWPVLVEQPPEFSHADTTSAMTMRVTQQIAWLTQQEFRERFGDEPPTTPILRALALPYADHPDYRSEWTP